MEGDATDFGVLLRRYRGAAGMTQEDLAEKSGLSAREIRRLERGKGHRPRPSTVAYLAGALDLPGPERRIFEEAALHPTGATASESLLPQPGDPTEPLTPLLGRDDLVREAATFLGREGVRLLTLVGPGGVGKTRVGLRMARELGPGYPDGAVLVGLATVDDPALVAPAIARAVGLRDAGGRPTAERLLDHLRDREMLMLLDNFEQVRAAAPLLVGLLAACPGLKALVTSRVALRVRGEQEFAVPPLGTPPPDLGAAELSRLPAVALFVERARAVDPSFRLTGENGAAVAGICRHLDGLPLALELAASRVTLLPPAALLARLEQFSGLALLTGGGQDMPERQRTMRRTVEWSHDLLNEDEKVLLRRLAVFSGGCTPQAAEAACSDDGHEDGTGVLDVLSALVDAILLWRRVGRAGEVRVGMLGTIGDYARDRLAKSGEEAVARGRHAAYFLRLAEEAEPHLRGPHHKQWLDRLELEHDNLRAALGWARQTGDAETGLRLAGALRMFWWTRGHLEEGRARIEGFLHAARDRVPPRVLAAASYAAGQLAYGQGAPESAAIHLESALKLHREIGEGPGTAATLVELGQALRACGDGDRAAVLSREGLEASRALGDIGSVAVALNTLGQVARDRGEHELSAELHEEALTSFGEAGDKRGHAYTLGRLGILALERGEIEPALGLHEESFELYEELKDKSGRAYALVNLGDAARARGEEVHAATLYDEALTLHRELGNERGISRALERLATSSQPAPRHDATGDERGEAGA